MKTKELLLIALVLCCSMGMQAQCNDTTYICNNGYYYRSSVMQMPKESYLDALVTIEGPSGCEFGKMIVNGMKLLFSKERLREMGDVLIIFNFYFNAIKKELVYVEFTAREDGISKKIPLSNHEMCLLENYFKSQKYQYYVQYKIKSPRYTLCYLGIHPSKLVE
jgi:hypothetical protein